MFQLTVPSSLKILILVFLASYLPSNVELCAAESREDLLPMETSAWKRPNWNTVSTNEMEDDGKTQCIRLETARRDWSQQITCVVGYSGAPTTLVFRGRVKTKDVKGGGAWNEKARAQLVFLDQNGEMVGEWPSTSDFGGTMDWTPFTQTHNPPAETRYIKVMIGMYVSTGTAWYDRLSLTAYDKDGKRMPPLPRKKFEATDTKGWWVFKPEPDNSTRTQVIDFSPFLPKPAGKFGFVQVKDGHFVAGDSGRVRFWGSGSCDFFPTKTMADAEAARLARFGVNIVRLHGLDAFRREDSIFDSRSEKTDKLDPDKLDRLDYYIAALKLHGIYVDLNLLTKRGFTAADGVRDSGKLHEGGKAAAMFNRRLIDLQKEYNRLILDHVNPYTKFAYKDDPGIALIEIINEAHLFDPNLYGGMPPSYDEELDGLFAVWCQKNKVAGAGGSVKDLLKQKNGTVFKFLSELQNGYYREMVDYLRKDIGVRVPICGSNQANDAADLLSNSNLDYIDRHVYWDHPAGGWEPTSVFTNKSLLKSKDSPDNYIPYLARQHVAGRPFTVSEWNNVWPNEWIVEGPVLMAGYGCFHDWDALMVYGFLGRSYQSQMGACFEVDSKPHFLASFVAAGLLYLRGDVEPGPILKKNLSSANFGQTAGIAFSLDETLKYRTLLSVEGKSELLATGALDEPLIWTDDCLIINTPRTQGYVGFGKEKKVKTRDLLIESDTPFAQILVQSLTDAPIVKSKHLLVTAVARAENTQQYYQLFKRGLLAEGGSPILMEPVVAKVEIKTGIKSGKAVDGTAAIYLLDPNGRRTEEKLPISVTPDGSYACNLSGKPAFWYEIILP